MERVDTPRPGYSDPVTLPLCSETLCKCDSGLKRNERPDAFYMIWWESETKRQGSKRRTADRACYKAGEKSWQQYVHWHTTSYQT